MATATDTFIQFINDNWNKKLNISRSSDLSYYVSGTPVNPNTGNGAGIVYGQPSDIFYDVASEKVYYKNSIGWAQFGEGYNSQYVANPAFESGLQIGHLPKTTNIGDLALMSLSEIIDAIMFKVYEPSMVTPIYNYNLMSGSNIITNDTFEVGSSISDFTFDGTIDKGAWYVEDIDLVIDEYAITTSTPDFTFKKLTPTSTVIAQTTTQVVLNGEMEFNLIGNMEGINPKVNTYGTQLLPVNTNITYPSADNIKSIFGNYYTFIATSSNINILASQPRTFLGNGKTQFQENEMYVNLLPTEQYMVMYIAGDYTSDASYKLSIVDDDNNAIENNIKFNNAPTTQEITLLNGDTKTYTKHVMGFIAPLEYKLRFKLELI